MRRCSSQAFSMPSGVFRHLSIPRPSPPPLPFRSLHFTPLYCTTLSPPLPDGGCSTCITSPAYFALLA